MKCTIIISASNPFIMTFIPLELCWIEIFISIGSWGGKVIHPTLDTWNIVPSLLLLLKPIAISSLCNAGVLFLSIKHTHLLIYQQVKMHHQKISNIVQTNTKTAKAKIYHGMITSWNLYWGMHILGLFGLYYTTLMLFLFLRFGKKKKKKMVDWYEEKLYQSNQGQDIC